jgi:tetratricopeptide (TPR) repeat protein
MADHDYEAMMREASRHDSRGDWSDAAALYDKVAKSGSEHAGHAEQCLDRVKGLQSLAAPSPPSSTGLQGWDLIAVVAACVLVPLAGLAAIMPGRVHPAFLSAVANAGVMFLPLCLAGAVIRLLRQEKGRFPLLQCFRYSLLFALPPLVMAFADKDLSPARKMARIFNASNGRLATADLEALGQLLSQLKKFDQAIRDFIQAYSDGRLTPQDSVAAMRACQLILEDTSTTIRSTVAAVSNPGALASANKIARSCDQQVSASSALTKAVEAGDEAKEINAYADFDRALESSRKLRLTMWTRAP